MLLIPIGQEHNTVRRYPWVSYAIVALSFLVFIGFEMFSAERVQQSELRRIQRDLIEHLAR
ncbi:MAG: hypothetical protein MUF51_08875 [Vicinamibacteria bacterium]|nr:hypothetical protein [Vicinamibacteria bacterium]